MEDGRGQKVTLVVVCLKFVEMGGHGPKEEDPWVNECGTYCGWVCNVKGPPIASRYIASKLAM